MRGTLFTLLALLNMLLFLVGCRDQPTPIPEPASFSLEPFAIEPSHLRGLAPDAWVELLPGQFYRTIPTRDPTGLAVMDFPGVSRDQVKEILLRQSLGTRDFPDRVGSVETSSFNWDLYTMEVKTPNFGDVAVDVGLAEKEGVVYAVLFATLLPEHAELHETVFMPHLESLALGGDSEHVATPLPAGPPPERDYWPTAGWRTSSPEEQGMDPGLLSEMLTYIEKYRNTFHIDSITIIRHGYVVLDEYPSGAGPSARHEIYSCTKSIASALVGIAIERGYLEGVDQGVLGFFPERTIANMDPGKKAWTLEHLLSMTSGMEWYYKGPPHNARQNTSDMMHVADDWIQFVLDRPLIHQPGERFYYSSGNAFLLSPILQGATGQAVEAFAEQNLFRPLGITGVTWLKNPQGIARTETGLRLTAHEMAKFGYLYLNHGRWDGRQIVPAEWVEASTRSHIFVDSPNRIGYGYLWWVNPALGYYSAIGASGQYITVLPEQDMVVVITSSYVGPDATPPTLLLAYFIIPAAQ